VHILGIGEGSKKRMRVGGFVEYTWDRGVSINQICNALKVAWRIGDAEKMKKMRMRVEERVGCLTLNWFWHYFTTLIGFGLHG